MENARVVSVRKNVQVNLLDFYPLEVVVLRYRDATSSG